MKARTSKGFGERAGIVVFSKEGGIYKFIGDGLHLSIVVLFINLLCYVHFYCKTNDCSTP